MSRVFAKGRAKHGLNKRMQEPSTTGLWFNLENKNICAGVDLQSIAANPPVLCSVAITTVLERGFDSTLPLS